MGLCTNFLCNIVDARVQVKSTQLKYINHPTRGGGFKSNLLINKGSKGEGLTFTAGAVVLKHCYFFNQTFINTYVPIFRHRFAS